MGKHVTHMSEDGAPKDADSERLDPHFTERIRGEIEIWRSEGVISDDAAEVLLARYESTEEARRSFSLNRLSGILAAMGAVLVGLGIVGLVAVNWSEISSFTKLLMLVTFTSASYVAGWLLAYRMEYARVGIALILLGAILFGASIHLIAQSFNVEVNHPNLVTAWFLGVVPLAYVARSKALLVLSIVLLLSALGFRAQGWFEAGVESVSVSGFALVMAVYIALAGAMFAGGRLHARYEEFRHFVRTLEIWGFAIAGIGVYVLSWITLWRELEWWDFGDLGLSVVAAEYWILLCGFIIIAAACMFWAGRVAPHEVPDADRYRWELIGLLGIVGIAILAIVGLVFTISWTWIVFNVVIVIGVIAMINVGIRYNRGYMLNIAFILFGVTVLTRYFEIGAIFEILDQAIAYIVAGVLLIVMALGMERIRKNLLERMRSEALQR